MVRNVVEAFAAWDVVIFFLDRANVPKSFQFSLFASSSCNPDQISLIQASLKL